ncbi:uncharacterized protein LOC128883714 isoform X2 [Hylaeus volcanicus]|nr:uncharacterized protein LOC128883714 isoform X2 [Hylaeus volcanicus]
MERSRQEIPQLCTVPPSVIRAHENLRTDLFNNFFKGSQLYETLEEADATTKSESLYAQSWQRKLAPEVKQELKKLLLRRAITTLQCYEISRKEYTAKTLLYQKGLLHSENFNIIEIHYQNLVHDLEFLMFEANCLEHDWGTGLFQTACAIIQHENVTAQDQKRRAEVAKKTQSKTLQGSSRTSSILQ